MFCLKLTKQISSEKVTVLMLLNYHHAKIGTSNKRDVNENIVQDLFVLEIEKYNFKEKTDRIESEELLSSLTPSIIGLIRYDKLNADYIAIYNHYKCTRPRNCLFVLKIMMELIKVQYIRLSKHTTLPNFFWSVPP